jgi:hypothetical protein
MELSRTVRSASSTLAALLSALLAGCGGDDGPDPALVIARDRAADYGSLGTPEALMRARQVLEPFVTRNDAAAEDLLRAAFAELARESDVEHVARATPLVERAAEAGADADELLWARYRLAAAEYDSEAALPFLRELAQRRPDDFVVATTMAATLLDLGNPELEEEARAILRELIQIPQEITGAWHVFMLFKLGNSLQSDGLEEEARPLMEAFQGFQARGVASPGIPKHQPGTLGAIRPHAPRTMPIQAPSAPTGRLTAHELAGSSAVTDVHVVQLGWGEPVDVGAEFGAPGQELYAFTPDAVLVTAGSDGIGVGRGASAPATVHSGTALELMPFDRMYVGAT